MSTPSCERCGREFASRNKLFKHLKNPLGCAASASGGAAESATAPADAPEHAADTSLQLAELLARLAAEQGGMLQAASAGELLSRYHGSLLRHYQRSVGASAQDALGTWLAALVLSSPRALSESLCLSVSLTLCLRVLHTRFTVQVQDHPKLLSLERMGGELQLRCNDALAVSAAAAAEASSKPALVDAKAAKEAAARLRASICSKVTSCQEASPEGWVPVPWLVRAVEKRLAAYVLLAPRADLARAADPGRFGLQAATSEQLARRHFRRRRGGASWATLTANFREFALAEAASDSALWEWRENGPDWQERYSAEKRKSATEAEAYAVGSCFKSHLRLSSRATAGGAEPPAAPYKVAAEADAGGNASGEKLLDPHALTPSETTLLVIAGQAPRGRIGEAAALELQLCARHHGVSSYLVPVSPGLWALQRTGDDDAHKRANFIAEVRCRCAALRRSPLLFISITPTGRACEPTAVASAIASLVQSSSPCWDVQFSLETEGLYPENVSVRLPYHKPTAVVGFAVAVAAALGRAGLEHDPAAYTGGANDKHRLVAIEALSPHTADPSGLLILACEEATGGTGGSSGGSSRVSRPLLCESAFWGAWGHRSHQFEGCLDLHLATIAVNIARYVAVARQQPDSKKHRPLRLLDPCCGSGTITAAALGAGGWGQIVATELRPEWVEHTRTNLRSLTGVVDADETRLAVGDGSEEDGEQQPPAKRARNQTQAASDDRLMDRQPSGACLQTTWRVDQHDATLGFDCAHTAEAFDAVVANPPWGKRIGQGTDSSTLIVRSLLRQFPSAVHVIFCPSLARCVKDTRSNDGGNEGNGGEEGWEVLHEVKVGGKTSMFVLVKN